MARVKLVRPNSVVKDAWLNIGNLDGLEINNPLIHRSEHDIENPGLLEVRLMRDPAYISYAAKVLLDIDLLPVQAAILQEMWDKPFPMYIASRGFGKSFLLAIYTVLKCALCPGTKIVTVGAAFRQSKVIYEYVEKIWNNAPVLRSICTQDSGPRGGVDRCTLIINDSSSIYIPIGDGSKIRGLRASIIICDEFASVPIEIFETVIRGFAAVSAKPVDNVREYASREALRKLGQWDENREREFLARTTNQCIISGTADYAFMPYADYWKKYYTVIHSEGKLDRQVKLPNNEIRTLRDYYPDGLDESFNHEDYIIIRIPYEKVPRGFMDDKIVAAARAGTHQSIYMKEYGAVFPEDSDGFFKRSLIQSCVASEENGISINEGPPIIFDPCITGSPAYKYVYGIDPAAEADNFSIVILELHSNHTRIVYCWSTNIKDFEKRKKANMVEEYDYYGFCARKIRNLMKVFPTEDIAIDAQGGGRSILEAFHDPNKLQPGEHFLWPTNRILDPDKELPTDVEPGLHICHMCQFVHADFTSGANHGTRKDMEDKVLLFPRFDPVSLELAAYRDAETQNRLGVTRLYDTLEDCVMEIEALKDELSTIVMTRTSNSSQGRDRWDTPETVSASGKKIRLRKDRYSALIMANYIARSIHRAPAPIAYSVIGGFAHQIVAQNKSKQQNEAMYHGPEWFTSSIEHVQSVKKRN